MKNLHALDWAVLALLIVGGINWGSVGLFNTDLVAELFGDGSGVSRAVYTLVGLAAVYGIFLAPFLHKRTMDSRAPVGS